MPDTEEGGGEEKRRGWLRPATWVEIAIVAVVLALLLDVVLSVDPARDKARTMLCTNNQKQMALAILAYGNDVDEVLPDSNTVWSDLKLTGVPGRVVVASAENPIDIHVCPFAPELANSYVYNHLISGKTLGEIGRPLDTVFAFADGQHIVADGSHPNVAFTMADLDMGRHTPSEGVWPFRHKRTRKMFVAAFLDGHAAVVTPEEAKAWLPE